MLNNLLAVFKFNNKDIETGDIGVWCLYNFSEIFRGVSKTANIWNGELCYISFIIVVKFSTMDIYGSSAYTFYIHDLKIVFEQVFARSLEINFLRQS